jgi:hypothetical protein
MSRIDAAAAAVTQTQETQQLRDALNRTLRALDKACATKEDLVEAVYRASLDAFRGVDIPAVPKPAPDHRKGREEVAVLVLSDWQLGKKTPTYSSGVCAKRIALLTSKVRQIAALHSVSRPVRDIHCFAIGDFLEGELVFPGQAHRIDASLYRQLATGTEMYVNLLRALAGTFRTVTTWEVDGNHGAIGGSQRREMHPETNADRILYHFAAELTAAEPRIVHHMTDPVGEANWYHVAAIGKYRSLLVHGQEFRGTAGMPWYSIQKHVGGWALGAINDFVTGFGAGGDVDIDCGHWHMPASITLNHVTFRCNGSTESYNTYAQQQLASVGRPSQSLRFVDPVKGRVTACYTIWLD